MENLNPRSKFVTYTLIVLGILFILSLCGLFVLYRNYRALQKTTSATASIATQDVIDRVSKLMVLPKDEEPTLATVSDPGKLKDQPFFAEAKKGDQVLVYTKAKKVILYDPDANIILNVAPLTLTDK